MIADKNALVVCPICSAENTGGASSCFLCGQSLVGAESAAAKEPGGIVAPAAAHRPTFRLNSMMLVIAAIAIFLGVWHESPVLAFWLAIPASIALFRTVAVARERGSWFNHVIVYIVTFTSVIGVAILGFAAFFATCAAIVATSHGPNGPYGGDNIVVAFAVGAAVGLAVIIGLTVAFVRASRRRRDRRGR